MVETVQYIFILVYEVMEFLINGHGKSWKRHGISFADIRGNPVSVPNHERTQKTDHPQEQKKLFTLLESNWRDMHHLRDQLLLDSLMGPAVAGSTDGTGCIY